MTLIALENNSPNRHRVRPKVWLLCSTIALLCTALSPQSHAATIVDFDHINSAPAWFVLLPSPYEEDGVVITNTASVSALPIISTLHIYTTGTPQLMAFDDPLNLVISAADVAMGVSLESINLIDFSQPVARTLTFYGTRFDDTIVAESITTDGVLDILGDGGVPEFHTFTTLAAEPFKSIAVSIGSHEVGIDNIAVRLVSPSTAPVPEASTGVMAVVLLGALLLPLHRSRRLAVAS